MTITAILVSGGPLGGRNVQWPCAEDFSIADGDLQVFDDSCNVALDGYGHQYRKDLVTADAVYIAEVY
jgi:hypothetical protein